MKIKRKTKRSVQQVALTVFIFMAIYTPLETQLLAPTREWIGFELQPETSVIYAKDLEPTPSPHETTEVVELPSGEGEIAGSNVTGGNSTDMEEIIKDVFGEHADKAFQLLQGEGCSENRALNPEAINDNRTWGGVGRDIGLFQINEYWQGIRHEGKADQFLMDPEINTRIAWRLYQDDNYSFKLWTCGRHHGI